MLHSFPVILRKRLAAALMAKGTYFPVRRLKNPVDRRIYGFKPASIVIFGNGVYKRFLLDP